MKHAAVGIMNMCSSTLDRGQWDFSYVCRISQTFCGRATLCTLWGLNVCWQSGGALVCSSALDPGQSPGQSPGHGGRGHFDFTGGAGGFHSLA